MDVMNSPEIGGLLNELREILQEAAFVHVTNQWRMVEIQLAKLQAQEPEAYRLIVEAWAADGWLVQPPWAAED